MITSIDSSINSCNLSAVEVLHNGFIDLSI